MSDVCALPDASTASNEFQSSSQTEVVVEVSQGTRHEKKDLKRQFSGDSGSSITSETKMINDQRATSCVDDEIAPCKLSENAGRTTISFHNITYEVKEKLDDVPLCGKMGKKEILKDVRFDVYFFVLSLQLAITYNTVWTLLIAVSFHR